MKPKKLWKQILQRIIFQIAGSLVGQMKQFSGTVQVMKAVSNHMVLTFCENLPGSQLFSIILSRKPDTMSMDVSFHHRWPYHCFIHNFKCFCYFVQDLQSVRSLLNRRGLSAVSIRRVCNGSTSVHSISIVSLLVTTFLAFLLKHR